MTSFLSSNSSSYQELLGSDVYLLKRHCNKMLKPIDCTVFRNICQIGLATGNIFQIPQTTVVHGSMTSTGWELLLLPWLLPQHYMTKPNVAALPPHAGLNTLWSWESCFFPLFFADALHTVCIQYLYTFTPIHTSPSFLSKMICGLFNKDLLKRRRKPVASMFPWKPPTVS